MDYGYIRVSTAGQAKDGNSIDAQRADLIAAGADPEQIFVDVYTGTTTDRPKMDELLSCIKNGDRLFVTKLDRIARSVTEGSLLIQELVKKGVAVRILNLGNGPIDNSPTGNLLLHIMLAFAEFERDMIVQRTQEGKAIAKLNPNFREGRPKKFSRAQMDHAMDLLASNSYKQVTEMTGISKATLAREKSRRSSVKNS